MHSYLKLIAPAHNLHSINMAAMLAAAKKAAYDSYEQEIFEELSALVSDSGALHTFLEAALKLESSALLSSVAPGPNSIMEVPSSFITAFLTQLGSRVPSAACNVA